MENIDQIFNELIGKNEIEESFDLLFRLADHLKNSNKLNQLVILKSWYFNVTEKEILGISDEKITRIEKNKIVMGLLEIKENLMKDGNLSISQCSDPCKQFNIDLKAGNSYSKNIFDRSALNVTKYSDQYLLQKALVYEKYIETQENLKNEVESIIKHDFIKIIINRLVSDVKIEDSEIENLLIMPYSNKYGINDKLAIIGATTIRLVNEFDNILVESLINYLLTFKERIWEKAIVSLVLVIRSNYNKLLLYPDLITKLEKLKEISTIQEAINIIDNDLKSGTYKKAGSVEEKKYINFKSEYWNQVENWFKPFDLDEKIIVELTKKLPNITDIHIFPSLLLQNKHMSSQKKYDLFINLGDISQDGLTKIIALLKEDNQCKYDHRFDTILGDYFSFIKNYSEIKNQSYLEIDVSIYELPISNIIASKYYEYMYFAEKYFASKEHSKSIDYFKKAINENPIGRSCNYCKIFNLFIETNDRFGAAEYSKISYHHSGNIHDLFSASKNYFLSNQIEKGIEYMSLFEQNVVNFNQKINLAKLYIISKNIEKSEKYFEKLIAEYRFDETQKHEAITFLIFKSFFKGDFDEVKKHFFSLKEVGVENQSIKFLLEIFENNSLEGIKSKLIDFEKTEKDGTARKLFLTETLAIAKSFDTFAIYSDKIKIIEDVQKFEIKTD